MSIVYAFAFSVRLRTIKAVPHLIAVHTIPIGLDAIVFPGANLTFPMLMQEIRLVTLIVTGMMLTSVPKRCQPLSLVLVKHGIVH